MGKGGGFPHVPTQATCTTPLHAASKVVHSSQGLSNLTIKVDLISHPLHDATGLYPVEHCIYYIHYSGVNG
jgi:hypothetical protein